MAAKKTQAIATRGNAAIANFDEELARLAEEAATQEANTGGGQFFSIRGGTLSLGGAPIPNNEMIVVIADAVLVNALYDSDYDPDAPRSPVCYAFGRDEKAIAPHADSEERKAEGCADCPLNQFGSAEKGRGKACKNGRRLALISAGELSAKTGEFTPSTAEELAKAPIAYLNVPPTSINSYGTYVKTLLGATKRPPQVVFTKVSLVPDPKTQVKVCFELFDQATADLVPTLLERAKEARAAIEFPFPKSEQREAPAPRAQGKGRAPAGRRF